MTRCARDGGGGLLAHTLGGGVPPNPGPISDPKIQFSISHFRPDIQLRWCDAWPDIINSKHS